MKTRYFIKHSIIRRRSSIKFKIENMCDSVTRKIRDISKEPGEKASHLEFLNGFRGTLCLLVLMHHSVNFLELMDCDYKYFVPIGYYIGVPGFFLLSSYLLTYRLYEEFLNVKYNCKSMQLIVVKYVVRRAFRVYAPFAVFVTMAHFIAPISRGPFEWKASWWSMISLQDTARSHMWTIAPETKYYACIPVFAYTSSLITNSKKRIAWYLFLLAVIAHMEGFFRPFGFNQIDSYRHNDWELLTRFTTFFMGSILAILVHDLKKSPKFKEATENQAFRATLGLVSLGVYIKGMILFSPAITPTTLSVQRLFFYSSAYWTVFLLILICGAPNFFTDLFTSTFLKLTGKFSFGIYLYHMMCIKIVILYFKETARLQTEMIVYVVGMSFVAGCAFYYLLENNFINVAHRICQSISAISYFRGESKKICV